MTLPVGQVPRVFGMIFFILVSQRCQMFPRWLFLNGNVWNGTVHRMKIVDEWQRKPFRRRTLDEENWRSKLPTISSLLHFLPGFCYILAHEQMRRYLLTWRIIHLASILNLEKYSSDPWRLAMRENIFDSFSPSRICRRLFISLTTF